MNLSPAEQHHIARTVELLASNPDFAAGLEVATAANQNVPLMLTLCTIRKVDAVVEKPFRDMKPGDLDQFGGDILARVVCHSRECQ